MIIGLILIFALFGLFFWNLRQVKSGVKGSLIAGGFIITTLGSFLLYRNSVIFSYLQTVMIIWICQALWIFLLWDIFRIVRRLKTKRRLLQPDAERQAGFLFGMSFALTVVFLTYGMQHNQNYELRFETVKLAASPAQSPAKNFTALYFSDLHLDMLSKPAKLERMITEAKSIRPDFILFGGDLADIHDSLMTAQGYDVLMKQLVETAKIGAVAIDGNHEAYMERSGSDPQGWLRRAGFTVLEDSTACFSDENAYPVACFTGRTDFQVARSRDVPRKPLADLVPDQNVPWLLLDHQPKGIESDYQGRLPDFAMSGHTHDGQFFPATLFIDLFWRLSAGFGVLDGAKWLVTSGIDSWGPPVRVGSDTEMWVLTFER
ncbi:MAG: metallophosphoesterase [Fibrobacter sp.]|nr:metallophosphoesterase [Fibrobacter sp.]